MDTALSLPPDQPRLQLCGVIGMPDKRTMRVTCRDYFVLTTEDIDFFTASAEEHICPSTKRDLR